MGFVYTNKFNWHNALFLAKAAEAAYVNGDVDLGPDWVIYPFSDGPAAGFVAKNEHGSILSFRGTDDLEDCKVDIDAHQVKMDWYPGKVHRGFAKSLETVWDQCPEVIDPLKPLWVTGHSLGGAMATLAAERLKTAGMDVALYTFGSPRVGNMEGVRKSAVPHYRFVNDCDLVPNLPGNLTFLGFSVSIYGHTGELFFLGEDGRVRDLSRWGQFKATGFRGIITKGGLIPQCVDDHRMANYIKAIQANITPE